MMRSGSQVRCDDNRSKPKINSLGCRAISFRICLCLHEQSPNICASKTAITTTATTTLRYFRWTRPSRQRRRPEKKSALTDSPEGIISFTFTYRPYTLLTLAPAIISTQNIANCKSTTQVFNAHSFCTSFSPYLASCSANTHTHIRHLMFIVFTYTDTAFACPFVNAG